MNRRALLFLSFFFISFFFLIPAPAQLPEQFKHYDYMQPMHETTVSITQTLASQDDMSSDGSGHHYVAQTTAAL